MPHGDSNEFAAAVKEFILTEFLPDESPDALTDTTPLLTTRILDSIATLRVVWFLETRFGISIPAHEMNVDHLSSVATVTEVVRAKQGGVPA